MKKRLLLLTIFSLMSSMTSCSKSNYIINNVKFANADTYVNLKATELETFLTSDDDFVLLVGTKDCLSCVNAEKNLRSYVKETENLVYYTELSSYKTIQAKDQFNNILPVISISPVLLFFKSGDVIKTSKNLDDKETMHNLIKSYLRNDNLYSLNSYKKPENKDYYNFPDYQDTSLLEQMTVSNSSEIINTVYFTWLPCGDCQDFHKNFFNNYVNELTKNQKIYIFETSHYRDNKPSKEPTLPSSPTAEEEATYQIQMQYWALWKQFSTKFGFIDYRDGKVPSIVSFKNGVTIDYVVYSNDRGGSCDNDNVCRYEETFFPAIKDITASSLDELKDKASSKELELIKIFLDKYVKGE